MKYSTEDFKTSDLPCSRRAALGFAIKNRPLLFWDIGLICFLASLIPLAPIVIRDLTCIDYHATLVAKGLEAAEIETDYASFCVGLYRIIDLILIPCLGLMGVILSGISRIIRQLFWGEPIFFKNDYFAGIRSSWLTFLLFFLLSGILNWVSSFVYYLSGINDFLRLIPYAFLFIIYLPIGSISLVTSSIYEGNPFKQFFNAAKIFSGGILSSLGTSFLLSFPFAFLLLSTFGVKYLVCYVVYALYFLLVFPIAYSILFLNCSRLFDKYVNPGVYDELINKGLYH